MRIQTQLIQRRMPGRCGSPTHRTLAEVTVQLGLSEITSENGMCVPRSMKSRNFKGAKSEWKEFTVNKAEAGGFG